MANDQEKANVEDLTDEAADEVKNDAEPTVADAADNANGESAEQPSSALLEQIKSQIEYYFGNVNLHRDKFLIEQTKLEEGWVPMSIMLNFKLLANLSKDVDVILKALETSDLMEISEDRKKIRRSPKHPLPEFNEEYRKAQEARTVYVKGFQAAETTIEELKAFFDPYKPIETIVMRKYQDKDKTYKFKGSVFVQFETLDGAKAFMDKESIKYGDAELIRKWSADYTIEKAQEKEERRKKNKSKKSETEEKETEHDQASVGANNKLPKGSVIFFSGVSKTCTREDIKKCLETYDVDIAYIDFQRGNTEGWIRLQGENAAKVLLDKTPEHKLKIHDNEVACRVLEGEEEDKYLAKVLEEMTATKIKFSKSKRGGAKKGRNARGKKRTGSPTHDAPSAKKITTE
ncbi:La protein-like protein [Ooceraea biroi]|uniref:La protein-like protein n=1 Tax=Ooceraea biroi TaxID=2015173 RepID=A0A026WQU4_OOCBI|nr:La protein-like protein [Ooceraea biroi]